MQREQLRALRAARSYAHNLELQARIESRLERAKGSLETYLLLNGVDSAQLGRFRVALDDGQLSVTRAPAEGCEQLVMAEIVETRSRTEADH